MNDKLAKALRKVAEYRQQTATPGIIPFPGIARMYQHPIYLRYDGRIPILQMETVEVDGKTITRPKTQLVPVVKPVRLDPQCAKGKYRALKRLVRRGTLLQAGTAARTFLHKFPEQGVPNA